MSTSKRLVIMLRSFDYNNGMKFTTKDKDQDEYDANRAVTWNGGWWYSENCFNVKLRGHHFEGQHEYGKGIHWQKIFHSMEYSFKKASMKVRRC